MAQPAPDPPCGEAEMRAVGPRKDPALGGGAGRKGLCVCRVCRQRGEPECRRKLLLTHLGANTRQDKASPLFLCGHSLPLASLPPG